MNPNKPSASSNQRRWLALAVLLPFLALFVANYQLLFVPAAMQIVSRPALKMFYIERTGSYVKTSTFMLEVYQQTRRAGIFCTELMGQFFDNYAVPEEERRARFACVVDKWPAIVPAGFQQGEIAANDYVFMTRDETGTLVGLVQGEQMAAFAAEKGYIPKGYFLEFYTPGRVKVQRAETLMAVTPRQNTPAFN